MQKGRLDLMNLCDPCHDQVLVIKPAPGTPSKAGFHCGFGWHSAPNLAAGESVGECNKYLNLLSSKMGVTAGSCADPNGHAAFGGVPMIAAFNICPNTVPKLNAVVKATVYQSLCPDVY